MKRPSRRISLAAATAILAVMVFTGCKTNSGSKEYTPGKGWKNAGFERQQTAAVAEGEASYQARSAFGG